MRCWHQTQYDCCCGYHTSLKCGWSGGCWAAAHVCNRGTKRTSIVDGLTRIVEMSLERWLLSSCAHYEIVAQRDSIIYVDAELNRNVAGAVAAVLGRAYAMLAPYAYRLLVGSPKLIEMSLDRWMLSCCAHSQ